MKHKSYIYAALTACLLCSCGDSFLDKRPQGSIDENALQTPAGIELLVTSTYANLTEDDWGASPMNWVFGSIYGGDANKGSDSGDQPPVNFFETYQLLANNDYLNQKWNWVYKGVNRANNALKV
ncbi:MAG: RagB/SusD family nutrient uptake outer membrane protein, partial [Tannerellaceae bacterium]